MTEPEPSVARPDARSLRGLAHPVRLRMLAILRTDGPATATTLAARLGLNTGATSYHLRQLAAHGFVVEDAARGNARDRWWRAAHRMTHVDLEQVSAEDREAGAAFYRGIVQIYTENMLAAVEEMPLLPSAWRGAGSFGDELLRLTPEETRRLASEVHEIVARYRRDSPTAAAEAEGTVPVSLQFQLFPRPGVLAPEESS
ncbi:helix-turn-helix domain-containing protein [Tenggerimyces flavus]|uniref:Helix-turn-helix domain-containing protein n=1 Tax=Tenggerimyces flavus TaxID=1708749 RepID=A0ABV7YLI0_9ACTN|nr:helix-turn-helix domain-containing protein [Tenggerimyces flavus]MBM7789448.1 DNA-binding transcriptional ArsR family regulator [Tenggerimyces flavus]